VTVRTFIDTNLLVYADDAASKAKQKRAQARLSELIGSGSAVLSTQILQEYFAIATRKLGLPVEAARQRVETLAKLDVVRIEPELILAAIDLHHRRKISFWEALVLRAAVAGGCGRLLSEDLGDGVSYEGVRVENPFR
jgi:predicted nucleic acid-binding protein